MRLFRSFASKVQRNIAYQLRKRYGFCRERGGWQQGSDNVSGRTLFAEKYSLTVVLLSMLKNMGEVSFLANLL